MSRMAKSKKRRGLQILVLAIALLALPAISGGPALGAPPYDIVDGFESELLSGTDGNGIPIGFYTFSDGSPVSFTRTDTPPVPPVPDAAEGNSVLQLDVDVVSFAGVIHGFENEAVDTWVPQDWSTKEGLAFWLYGNGSGTSLFIDILENRNPGSTTDDAERWSFAFTDNFSGWQLLEFPFTEFTRKGIGNGAPNDGFDRFEVHGWALGTLGTGGPITYYVDDVALYGDAPTPALSVGFAATNFDIAEGGTGDITVKLNRPIGIDEDDPAQVSVDYYVEELTPIPGREYTPVSGTLTFVDGGPRELSFPFETFDDGKYEPDERVILRLSNEVDVVLGTAQASVTIVDNDPFDPLLLDDFELFPYLWDSSGDLTISNPEIAAGDSLALPGQGEFERVLQLDTGYDTVTRRIIDDLGAILPASTRQVTKQIEKAIKRLEQSLDSDEWINGFLLDPDDGKQVFDRQAQAASELLKVVNADGPEAEAAQAAIDQIVDAAKGLASFSIELSELNGGSARDLARALSEMDKAQQDLNLNRPDRAIRHYRNAWDRATEALDLDDDDLDDYRANGDDDDEDGDDDDDLAGLILPALGTIARDFPIGQDWSGAGSLAFRYHGQNSGDTIRFELLDNRAPDPGPGGWSLVWSDEFDDPAGTPPNPAIWGYENGDGTVNGIPGWGNSELQYYSDSPDNVATDGEGNLVITAQEADDELCYYGPCEYTSARLVTKNRAEFAYGRIESRILVPPGEDGLWPAFWSLGTDIDIVTWPQTGEIDIMEYVSREPNEIFGTIHGPGYSGGNAFGDFYHFEAPAPPGLGLVISFDETPQARLEPFEGLVGEIVAEPGNTSNNVASLTKPSGAQPWAGTLVYTQDSPAFSIPEIPFSDGNTTVTMRFWTESPAGTPVMLKLENAGNPGQFSEVIVYTTTSGVWETLSFDFSTVGLDTDLVWNKVAVFPDFLTPAAGGSYYVDDISFPDPTVIPVPVADDYHTFTIEWEPNLINWYVDGIHYHSATPADVSGEWVFNDPIYLLLNLALGGNFGGPLSDDLTFPQEMKVDYVRVYQGVDTAERFETSFVDNFTGWQQVIVPFTALTRSADQPDDAPDDGLNLDEVWGYGFELPYPAAETYLFDQVRLVPLPPPTEITVTNLGNSGAGSLRQALEDIAVGGTITFDPALAGGTIPLLQPLVIGKDVTVNAGGALGISLDGGGVDRVLIVDPGVVANVSYLTMTNGFGFQLAGCVLNNGTLTLDHSTVTGCLMTTNAGDFWQGGGGIYNGDGAALNLVDSTVANNSGGWDGGGVFSFFNTTTNLTRSTISGNTTANVGGGLRILGNGDFVNSTISGNASLGWHGGGMFVTDGIVDILNTTITSNSAPGGAAGGIFSGSFGGPAPTVSLANTIVAANGDYGCQAQGGNVVSSGGNVLTDTSCGTSATALIVGDAGLDTLADNGGPTQTHALLPGSPAIDAGDSAVCPDTDQRGVARDAACDVGSYEYVP